MVYQRAFIVPINGYICTNRCISDSRIYARHGHDDPHIYVYLMYYVQILCP